MAFLDSIFSLIGKYADTAGNLFQGVTAVQSYLAQQEAEKQTKRANANMMAAAQTEADLAKQDAAQKADALRRDAFRARATQITSFLKSGVTLDGTPLLVANETQDIGNRNAENTKTNADYTAKSIMLRAEANKQIVKKADIFGTAFDVFGSLNKASSAYTKSKQGG